MKILKYIFQIFLIIICLRSLFHWVRTGFWVPKYIHFIAIGVFLISGFLSYQLLKINNNWIAIVLILICFPLSVYLLYGFYGGGEVSRNIILNENFVIDRAMLIDEVKDVFNEHCLKFTNWNFEKLLEFSKKSDKSERIKLLGKKYSLKLTFRESNFEEDETIVIYCNLKEIYRFFYKPESILIIEIGKSGKIYRNGLNICKNEIPS